jgi:hypothetical protein
MVSKVQQTNKNNDFKVVCIAMENIYLMHRKNNHRNQIRPNHGKMMQQEDLRELSE